MRTSRFFVASLSLPTGLKPVLFSSLGDASSDVDAAAGDLTLGAVAAGAPRRNVPVPILAVDTSASPWTVSVASTR